MKRFKIWLSKGFAITVSVLTALQLVLPTYAQESTTDTAETQVVTSNVNVEVEGDGEVVLEENGNKHTITKDEKYTGSFDVGTSLHFDIEEQEDLYISSFKENDIVVSEFEANSTSFEYDYTTTESDVTYVISFERNATKEDSGVSDENQGAEDEDVGEYGIMLTNDSGGAGGDTGDGGGTNPTAVRWWIYDDDNGALGWALTNQTSGSANVDAVYNVISSKMGMTVSDVYYVNGKRVVGNARAKMQSSLEKAIAQCKQNYINMFGTEEGFKPRIVAVGVSYIPATNSAYKHDEYNQTTYSYDWSWNNSWDKTGASLTHGGTAYTKDTQSHNTNQSLSGFAKNQLAGSTNIRIIVLDETEPYPLKGSLKIVKSSANPSMTDNNNCYGTMEGAKYGLYSDAAATQQVGTFTMDENGESNTIEDLDVGTYYLKELEAPEGYAKDETIQSVSVNGGTTTTKEVKDLPQSDPIPIILGKVDATTNANKPQGSASLAGAEFTVKYYDGYYTQKEIEESKMVLKPVTWVFKTDEDGFCYLSDEYKVSGPDLFYKTNGDPTLPLGTVTIQETKAPEGYKLNDELIVKQITSDGEKEIVQTYNQPEVKEEVISGEFVISKFITDANNSQIVDPEVGAKFGAVLEKYYEQANGDMEKALEIAKENGTEMEYSIMETDANGEAYSFFCFY